ncbi:hypothetical protein PVAP13_7NG328317 [Panicum virgatum]|uniref:Uncharacterized protein n=1 Tax=Panicum virgatum TaxID=38727 RepID=A0A8T0PWW3_PANVG|nr:hypothetical protein PVAP13_7NG328317 [Panicum virgatum]
MLDAVLECYAKSQLTRSDIAKLFTDMFIGASETSNITAESWRTCSSARTRWRGCARRSRRAWGRRTSWRRATSAACPALPPRRGEGDATAAPGGAGGDAGGGRGRRRLAGRVPRGGWHLRPRQPLGHREGPGGVARPAGGVRDGEVPGRRRHRGVALPGGGLRLPAVRRGAEDVSRVGLRVEVRAAGAGLHAAQDRVEAAGGDGPGGRGPQRPLHSGAQARQSPSSPCRCPRRDDDVHG